MTSPATSSLNEGLKGTATTIVTEEKSAIHVGSGSVAVYATPMMVALMEAAAVDCVEHLLPDGFASLGTHLTVEHIQATPLGLTVAATATLTAIEGRKLTFDIEARDSVELIGQARHTRVIVDTPRFHARLETKGRQT